MSYIEEFQGPDAYAEAVEASFDTDMCVVRNLISDEFAEELLQSATSDSEFKTIFNPIIDHKIEKAIPNLKIARRQNNEWIARNMGRFASRMPLRQSLRPDKFKRGPTKRHIDMYAVVVATSVQLTDGSVSPTTFHAKRIAPSTAKFDVISDAYDRHTNSDLESESYGCTEMGVGDAVIITRGVAHSVKASYDRRALLLSTKNLFAK